MNSPGCACYCAPPNHRRAARVAIRARPSSRRRRPFITRVPLVASASASVVRFRLRRKRLGGARVRLLLGARSPCSCTSSWISSVDRGARSMRSSSSPDASSSMIKCGFFPGLKSMTRPLVAVGVARLLHEALHLLQFVELSATTRLDPSLRGERRRRDEQQPASGRGFLGGSDARDRLIDLCWASGARALIARSRQACCL